MQPNPPNPALSIESLLAHADWVRALAKRLVADPASAEDLEQEVWRTALESPPRDATNPRGWLASVARNAARTLGRSGSRREQRERASARPESLPPTSELVAEAELARELAGEVLALEEPYRTVLLLRYWRALSPDDIARSQSIPIETVRTQLKRGLERLRERLDRRYGDREQWLAALAPLARETTLPLAGAAAGGVLALFLKFGAAAALAGAVWYAWPQARKPAERLAGAESAKTDAAVVLEDATASQTVRAPVRSAPADTRAKERSGSAGVEKHPFRGQVRDLDGHPVTGLEIEWRKEVAPNGIHWQGDTLYLRHTIVELPPWALDRIRSDPTELEKMIREIGDEPGFREAVLGTEMRSLLVQTRDDGDFDVELGEGTWLPECTDPHKSIVARIETPDFKGWTLLIAPSVKLGGRVVDHAGAPLCNVQFSCSFHLDRLEAFSDLRDQGWQWRTLGLSTQEGTFQFDRMPVHPEIRVEVQKGGYAPRRIELEAVDDPACEIVLQKLDLESRPRLSGVVLDPGGNPVPGATISLGQDAGGTDERGRFDFPIGTYHPDESLTVVKKGYQATVLASFGENHTQTRSDIVLRLGPPALSIEGCVRLPDGSNPGNCHIQVIDGTPFGTTHCTL